MTKFNFQVFHIIASIFAVVSLAGCSAQTVTNVNVNNSVNRAPSNANAPVVNTANSAPSNNINPAVSPANSAPTVPNNTTTDGKKTQPNAPTAKIGSGGNDFSILTSARAALSADKELINGVVIEVKDGNATLTGKASSEAQKKKAEELVRGVQGIKNVTNNLRVSQ